MDFTRVISPPFKGSQRGDRVLSQRIPRVVKEFVPHLFFDPSEGAHSGGISKDEIRAGARVPKEIGFVDPDEAIVEGMEE